MSAGTLLLPSYTDGTTEVQQPAKTQKKLSKTAILVIAIPCGVVLITLIILLSVLLVKPRSATYDLKYSHYTGPNPAKGFVWDQRIETGLQYQRMWFGDVYDFDYDDTTDTASNFRLKQDYIEEKLQNQANKKHQVILRVVMVSPEETSKIGENLTKKLQKTNDVKYTQSGSVNMLVPNFNNEFLNEQIRTFIKLFGEQYDGDPRIAFLQMGIYGSWGEWNAGGWSSDMKDYQMTNENLEKMVQEFATYFKKTPVMGRNPTMGGSYKEEYHLGFHDDNYLFNTDRYGLENEEWAHRVEYVGNGYSKLHQFLDFHTSSTKGYDITKRAFAVPYGSEISGVLSRTYRENGSCIFPQIYKDQFMLERFRYSQKIFPMSFVMSGAGMCDSSYPPKGSEEYNLAMTFHGEIGYDLFVKSAKTTKSELEVTFQNNGPAPYYYDWAVVATFTSDEDNTYREETSSQLEFIQVNETYTVRFPLPSSKKLKKVHASVRVINPLSAKSQNYFPVMLSNENCQNDGSVEIGEIKL